ncbi:hypothetical protein FHW16_000437 [Phyllobacterium myrsinacearum]|uniref:Uncharacterized protein n=1 Tax=Phyllobacterium myrsinacearum TaxID=28101 RepID=A0A839EEK8_9HYPH|nr:hypothetical protein [Phyllobacterium myrsinacearum]
MSGFTVKRNANRPTARAINAPSTHILCVEYRSCEARHRPLHVTTMESTEPLLTVYDPGHFRLWGTRYQQIAHLPSACLHLSCRLSCQRNSVIYPEMSGKYPVTLSGKCMYEEHMFKSLKPCAFAMIFECPYPYVRLMDTPPSTSMAEPVVKLEASEAR